MHIHIDETDQLSLQAVGLWHKLARLYEGQFDEIDVLTAMPDRNAWGPWGEEHDLGSPWDELLSLGFVEEIAGRFTLRSSVLVTSS